MFHGKEWLDLTAVQDRITKVQGYVVLVVALVAVGFFALVFDMDKSNVIYLGAFQLSVVGIAYWITGRVYLRKEREAASDAWEKKQWQ